MFIHKRYEDYTCEEIKAAMKNEKMRQKLVAYIYNDVLTILRSWFYRYYIEYQQDAEDWMLESYPKFIAKIENDNFTCGANPLQSLKAFWVGIAKFEFLNWVDSSKNPNQVDMDFTFIADENKEDEADDNLILLAKIRCAKHAFNQLTEKCQTIIYATEVEDKSYKEIMENPEILAKTGQSTIGALRQLKVKCMTKFGEFLSQCLDKRGNIK